MAPSNLKKTNPIAALLVSSLIPQRIFDESAETIAEMAQSLGIAQRTTRERIVKLIDAGKIERVWKHGPARPIPAYRIKK